VHGLDSGGYSNVRGKKKTKRITSCIRRNNIEGNFDEITPLWEFLWKPYITDNSTGMFNVSFSVSHTIQFSHLWFMVSSCPCTSVMLGQQLSKQLRGFYKNWNEHHTTTSHLIFVIPYALPFTNL
jgi:hypothetical protein